MVIVIVSDQHTYLHTGTKKYLPARCLVSKYVCRQKILNEMVAAVMSDHDTEKVSLTLTGFGGFGKTSLAIALCNDSIIHKHFTGGFMFIDLGDKTIDLGSRLRNCYNLLTDEFLNQCDIATTEQKINKFLQSIDYKVLVIIDDVWNVEDAKIVVNCFGNCKIVLTSRRNGIEQDISTNKIINVGPMENSEAVSLLTYDVIHRNPLSDVFKGLLEKLAENIHFWPLLLSLVRVQLSHDMTTHKYSYEKAINAVQDKLHAKGLIFLDKDITDDPAIQAKRRHNAVKACIEVTLDLLKDSLAKKLKRAILYTGICGSLHRDVLEDLWSVSSSDAKCDLDKLYYYGVVHIIDINVKGFVLKDFNSKYWGVHAVISQYIIENMTDEEIIEFNPFKRGHEYNAVSEKEKKILFESCGVNMSSYEKLKDVDFLKQMISFTEAIIKMNLQFLNNHITMDPRIILIQLRDLKYIIAKKNLTDNLPDLPEQIEELINGCYSVLAVSYTTCKTQNIKFQHCLVEKKYIEIINIVHEFIYDYSKNLGKVAKDATTLIKEIMKHCEGETLRFMEDLHAEISLKTPEYHIIPLFYIPSLRFHAENLRRINISLKAYESSGSESAESLVKSMYLYYSTGKYKEDEQRIMAAYVNKLYLINSKYVKELSKLFRK